MRGSITNNIARSVVTEECEGSPNINECLIFLFWNYFVELVAFANVNLFQVYYYVNNHSTVVSRIPCTKLTGKVWF